MAPVFPDKLIFTEESSSTPKAVSPVPVGKMYKFSLEEVPISTLVSASAEKMRWLSASTFITKSPLPPGVTPTLVLDPEVMTPAPVKSKELISMTVPSTDTCPIFPPSSIVMEPVVPETSNSVLDKEKSGGYGIIRIRIINDKGSIKGFGGGEVIKIKTVLRCGASGDI
ncbi:MAG: hypothetical protein UX45_C0044G0003 [Candidatus Uhrbacteria bacterium GW2011_GWF2_46_218]|uniref:Uncharacterized protein n=1 Tax=Candidatus Uhrbacteria bacterium GW2011_GWF2_46_218 TaxID=1619001 RepID=A0A0G1PCP0_9BACT|nr:MAG: hypothetical protein UX45_C0044G0003 [Candidatus Uhrbacteria bacterium GW2011_GWF2_46_218]